VLPRLLARSWPGLLLQVPSVSSLLKGVYDRSVPVWLIVLSDQLPVEALVGHYPTNKLIGRETLPKRNPFLHQIMRSGEGIRY